MTREAERRLGELLAQGRDDGTVAARGDNQVTVLDGSRTTMADLGVLENLAADAAAFARPPPSA